MSVDSSECTNMQLGSSWNGIAHSRGYFPLECFARATFAGSVRERMMQCRGGN